jgi:methionine aminopeptidase
MPNDSMTKTPNYELTPGEVRPNNPFKGNNSGSIKKFKDDQEDVKLKINPI